MKKRTISGLLCIGCISILALKGMAQSSQRYFIYIQNEAGSPFYVKTHDQLLSGSPAGYIILPQLKGGKQTFSIGFPKNEYPEEQFSLNVGDDQGYLLKADGEKKFVLYNMADFSLVKPLGKKAAEPEAVIAPSPLAAAVEDTPTTAPLPDTAHADSNVAAATAPADDPFSHMLDAVTGNGPAPAQHDDSASSPAGAAEGSDISTTDTQAVVSVQQTPAPVDSSSQNVLAAAVPDNEQGTLSPGPTDSGSTVAPDETAQSKAAQGQKQDSNGADLQFINFDNLTVTPVTGSGKAADAKIAVDQPAADSEASVAIQEEPQDKPSHRKRQKDKEAEDSLSGIANTNAGAVSTPADSPQENTTATVPAPIANSDCEQVADDDEFQKVRRKMASQHTEEGMLRLAERYFKSECFTTTQIQSLVYLFMSNENRYKFLDMGYAHASDASQYPRLEKVLTDNYYKDRFRAMVKVPKSSQ